MKSKFFFAVLTLGLVGAQLPAQARSLMPPVWSAQLVRFELDEQLPYKHLVRGAEIEVNYARKTTTLSIFRAPKCLPGQMCSRIAYPVIRIELPILDVTKDECGTKIIRALEDRRMWDGARQTLAIRDNTANHCPSFVARPATEVLYKTDSAGRGGVVSTRSTFEGEALRPEYSKM
ncbi:MAG: hypothetical protein HY074_00680 [Deltaproteobacteria bacterium]|nr:hypothetical protein [Deltaproteobacteria bacterium]